MKFKKLAVVLAAAGVAAAATGCADVNMQGIITPVHGAQIVASIVTEVTQRPKAYEAYIDLQVWVNGVWQTEDETRVTMATLGEHITLRANCVAAGPSQVEKWRLFIRQNGVDSQGVGIAQTNYEPSADGVRIRCEA